MSYTTLRVHFVTATKRRRPLLTADVEAYLYEILPDIVERCGGHLFAANGYLDHSHLLVALKPSVAPLAFIREVKSDTSRLIRRAFPKLDFRWQRSYSAFSVSTWDMQGLLDYIYRQKEHHSRETTRSAWEFDD